MNIKRSVIVKCLLFRRLDDVVVLEEHCLIKSQAKMKQFLLHVQFTNTQGVECSVTTKFSAENLVTAHMDGRKLVELLTCEPHVGSIDSYYLESLKIN